MKRIVLKSLTLDNWRGEKHRTTEFNAVETTVAGDNGLGKSRHFDAFVWLLFGKDAFDRKDHNIKTLVGGEPLHRVDCSVCGVFDADGESITLRRIYREKWVKKRGLAEEKFEGHECELYWNDVPLKVSEYHARVNEIIMEDSVFKMVTNPLYFARMDWKIQREQLFALAGTVTDAEIATQNPEFAALLDRISGKSFADFKREILARKKKLKDDLEAVQPRIDQTYKLMPEKVDFEALEAEISNCEAEISEIEKAIASKPVAVRQQYEAEQEKQAEINELKQQQQKVLLDAKTKSAENAYAANAERREIENSISVAETEIAKIEKAIASNTDETAELEKNIKSKTDERSRKLTEKDNLRKSWHDEKAKEYTDTDDCLVCPLLKVNCSDSAALALHSENKEKAREVFNANKQKQLAEITAKGKGIGSEVENLDKKISTLYTEKDILAKKDENLRLKLAECQKDILANKTTLAQTPLQTAKEVIPGELPEYTALNALIQGIESTLIADVQEVDTTELQAQKKGFTDRRDVAKSELQKRGLITKYTQEINDLEEQGKNLARQIADVEREEFVIQSFTKAKIVECEKRINGLFSFVRFKLFDFTIEGNEFETCIPLVDGVPFDTANTAGKVNAGLDIINALSRFYGICAPVFIDGRESVNHIIPTESQVINLVVTRDKQLVIK